MEEMEKKEQMETAAAGENAQTDRPAYPSRREQLKEITDRLEAGVKEYMTNDVQFKKVLEAMSKFHHYSANNVLLIAMQMPEAKRVAFYTTWKTKFNRQVMKGQKGLSIIAPAPVKQRREHTDWLKEVSGRSDFRANLEISAYDRVLTLSTCAYRFENARYVLHGKLVELR